MKLNWEAIAKGAKNTQRQAKSTKQCSELLSDFPSEGYMRDNISKNLVKISECKSSSLRRYVKLLNNFYYVVTSEKDKQRILLKKKEIEDELLTRPDATVEDEQELKLKKKIEKKGNKRTSKK